MKQDNRLIDIVKVKLSERCRKDLHIPKGYSWVRVGVFEITDSRGYGFSIDSSDITNIRFAKIRKQKEIDK